MEHHMLDTDRCTNMKTCIRKITTQRLCSLIVIYQNTNLKNDFVLKEYSIFQILFDLNIMILFITVFKIKLNDFEKHVLQFKGQE